MSALAVDSDSSFAGFSDLRAEEDPEAGIVLVAQLLGLLATFIGGDLMLRILLGVWPDLTVPDTRGSGELES